MPAPPRRASDDSQHPRAVAARMTYDPSNREHFEGKLRSAYARGETGRNLSDAQAFLMNHYQRAHGMNFYEARDTTEKINKVGRAERRASKPAIPRTIGEQERYDRARKRGNGPFRLDKKDD
jgi:hypothetical protein